MKKTELRIPTGGRQISWLFTRMTEELNQAFNPEQHQPLSIDFDILLITRRDLNLGLAQALNNTTKKKKKKTGKIFLLLFSRNAKFAMADHRFRSYCRAGSSLKYKKHQSYAVVSSLGHIDVLWIVGRLKFLWPS